jgi:hypothetical protein
MQKTVTLKVSGNVGGRAFQFPIENFIIKPGITSHVLLEKLGIPDYVLIRINRGLVLSPDAEVYPLINDEGEELIAAEIRWPKTARGLKSQMTGRIHS